MPADLQINIIVGAAGLVAGLAGGIFMRPRLERHRISHWDVLRGLIGLIIITMVVAGYIGQTTAARRLLDVTTCQHEANLEFSEALAQRGAANQQANVAAKSNAAALEQFVSQVAQGAHGPELIADLTTLQHAEQGYQVALDQLNATQVAHPLTVKDCGP